MVSPETNNVNPEQYSSEVTPLQLALDGMRTQFEGFVDRDQRKLAKLLDQHNSYDHSLEVISVDAQVKLNNQRPSPTPNDNVVRRTSEEKDELESEEMPFATKEEAETDLGRELQTWEFARINEIRGRKRTIRQSFDRANGRGQQEAKAYIDSVQKKHHTSHRPTTRLEKSAAERHADALSGSFIRKDYMVKRLAAFETAHGDEVSKHPDQKKNLKKQQRSAKRLTKARNRAEDELWRSMKGQGPEQFRIRMKQERVAQKIAKLSKQVRNKGLWIDGLFDLHPKPPSPKPQEISPEAPIEEYNPRAYEIVDKEERFGAPGRDTLSNQTRTERALELTLNALVEPDTEGNLTKHVSLDSINAILNSLDGYTPALAKFTLRRLRSEGFIDDRGEVVSDPKRIGNFIATNLRTNASTRPYEGNQKTVVANRLESIKNPADTIYAFALSHIGGFYSEKNGFQALPKLSAKSLRSAVKRGLKNIEIDDDEITEVHQRLIEQGILSHNGTVIQSRETIRGALGSLYGDDTAEKHPKRKHSTKRPSAHRR